MAIDIKTKSQLAEAAKVLSTSYEFVERASMTYIPVHWKTYSPSPLPPPEETIWLPLDPLQLREIANKKSGILFGNDSEFRNFHYMVRQLARRDSGRLRNILIRTPQGLQMLMDDGSLEPHRGEFTPNFIASMLNEDPATKKQVFDTLAGWLNSEENALSLLKHLATGLAPGWSAVKYVILLGEGRNGKSVLLNMLVKLFGRENVSSVTRQSMAERSSTCVELNNKLFNVIFDGEMSYIKDSSMEKTLIAGEPGTVRMLYESGTTTVQTNALFIEALNHEPKTRDKSTALQKRLVRFRFPNVYPIDRDFEKKMLSEEMLGAFLSLLIDNYVEEDEIAEALKITSESMILQAEQVWIGSSILQFLSYLQSEMPATFETVQQGKHSVQHFIDAFRPWAQAQGISDRSDGDLLLMVKTACETSYSQDSQGNMTLMITGYKEDTLLTLEQLKGQQQNVAVKRPGVVGGSEPVQGEGSDPGSSEETSGSIWNSTSQGVSEWPDPEGLGSQGDN